LTVREGETILLVDFLALLRALESRLCTSPGDGIRLQICSDGSGSIIGQYAIRGGSEEFVAWRFSNTAKLLHILRTADIPLREREKQANSWAERQKRRAEQKS
jgi:hypothetical protein